MQGLARREVETVRREMAAKARAEVDRALQWLGFPAMGAPPEMHQPPALLGGGGGGLLPDAAAAAAAGQGGGRRRHPLAGVPLPGENSENARPAYDPAAFERFRLRAATPKTGSRAERAIIGEPGYSPGTPMAEAARKGTPWAVDDFVVPAVAELRSV